MAALNREFVTAAWDGLTALLGVPSDVEVEDLEQLLDESPAYDG